MVYTCSCHGMLGKVCNFSGVSSCHHVGPGDQTQIIRPTGKWLYSLSHLAIIFCNSAHWIRVLCMQSKCSLTCFCFDFNSFLSKIVLICWPVWSLTPGLCHGVAHPDQILTSILSLLSLFYILTLLLLWFRCLLHWAFSILISLYCISMYCGTIIVLIVKTQLF